jgi:formamidopyrimidine-DNA glycosylase
MPELPEVEVVRRGLESGVAGRTIATVTVSHDRAVRRHLAGVGDFEAVLRGRTIAAVRRRGKYLWFDLAGRDPLTHDRAPHHLPTHDGASHHLPTHDGASHDGATVGTALLGHLGMSGQLLVVSPVKEPEKHLRVRILFTDGGRELRFVDQRTFGGLAVVPTVGELPAPIAHIARDPLDSDFDDDAFVAALRRRRTGVKRALLDQTLVSGIGNIYADESLWRAGVHYARPTETLPASTARALLAEARAVMTDALAAGGTSFDSLYVSVNGESGLFDRSLNVYGRAGQPCARCETVIVRDAFMNRSSFTCPGCQPRPRRARW